MCRVEVGGERATPNPLLSLYLFRASASSMFLPQIRSISPFFQGQDARLVVRDDLDHHTLDPGLFAPVGLIGLEHGVFVRDDLGQLVGPGAHIGCHAVLGGAVLHGLGRDDGKGAGHAQFREHGPVGGFHEDAERMGIGGIHLFQQMHHLQPGMAGAVLKDGVEVGLDGKRIARGPVGERDPLADMEGVDPCRRRRYPSFRPGRACSRRP